MLFHGAYAFASRRRTLPTISQPAVYRCSFDSIFVAATRNGVANFLNEAAFANQPRILTLSGKVFSLGTCQM